jgi:indoleacetamide hydrolase
MKDITTFTITKAAAAILNRQITSVELTEALLKKIELRKSLNAFIYCDQERALAAARRADQIVKQNRPLGLLHGIPLVLKDNIHVAGLPNTIA